MKRKVVLAFLYIIFSLVVIELVTKAYFLLPNSHDKILNLIEKNQGMPEGTRMNEAFRWDDELNYKWRGGHNLANLKNFFRYNLIGDDFEVSVNDEGFRISPEMKVSESVIEAIKNESGRKIICIGESWTMGWGVNYADSYPEQLQKILDGQASGEKYKVFNLGVITYTSFQGLRIMEKIAPYLKPEDIVVIGYQANDPRHGFMVKGIFNESNYFLQDKEFNDLVFRTERGVTSYKLAKILWSVFRGTYNRSFDSFWNYPPRVSCEGYVSNNRAMAELAQSKGAKPIFLYHGLFKEQDYTAKGLWEAAGEVNAPVVNVRDSMLEMVQKDAREMEEKYPALAKSDDSFNSPRNYPVSKSVKVLFRVVPFHEKNLLLVNPENVKKLEIRLLDRKDGKFEYASFTLNDLGENGDEVSGDGVWSVEAEVPVKLNLVKLAPLYFKGFFQGAYELVLFYFFRMVSVENDREKIYPEFNWEDKPYAFTPLFVNIWRNLLVGKIENAESNQLGYEGLAKEKVVYPQKIITPIALFGRQHQRSEFLHPTAEGYKIFAERMAEEIKNIYYKKQ
ncbi:MAG: hypothetical protein FJZ04_03925 [Candidatus Moranbacteria bacterium]|nr:hypothetical protein [Candidatus Moranbacteria bacterium]